MGTLRPFLQMLSGIRAAADRAVRLGYPRIHRWMVEYTRAYTRLLSEISDRIRAADFPRDLPGLLVPSATGEILAWLKDEVHEWWCVDSNPVCLEICSQVLPSVRTFPADLNAEWPFQEQCFGLVVSMHSLHWFHDPAALLRRTCASLAPGGLAVWVVFQGQGTRREPLVSSFRRMQREQGLMEALNFLPFRLGDQLMRVLSGRQHPFWTQQTLSALLAENGYLVEKILPTFNGLSLLAVTRKGTNSL